MATFEDTDDEEYEEEYIEQVVGVVCPHCKKPLEIAVGPAEQDDFEDEEDL